mmetsp:Transcript_29011/g.33184  ORF Transcript_29011/g.33184 Transcript_29011/m.33184 type:complete len:881 (-) Transcript_29011:192-2834(-)
MKRNHSLVPYLACLLLIGQVYTLEITTALPDLVVFPEITENGKPASVTLPPSGTDVSSLCTIKHGDDQTLPDWLEYASSTLTVRSNYDSQKTPVTLTVECVNFADTQDIASYTFDLSTRPRGPRDSQIWQQPSGVSYIDDVINVSGNRVMVLWKTESTFSTLVGVDIIAPHDGSTTLANSWTIDAPRKVPSKVKVLELPSGSFFFMWIDLNTSSTSFSLYYTIFDSIGSSEVPLTLFQEDGIGDITVFDAERIDDDHAFVWWKDQTGSFKARVLKFSDSSYSSQEVSLSETSFPRMTRISSLDRVLSVEANSNGIIGRVYDPLGATLLVGDQTVIRDSQAGFDHEYFTVGPLENNNNIVIWSEPSGVFARVYDSTGFFNSRVYEFVDVASTWTRSNFFYYQQSDTLAVGWRSSDRYFNVASVELSSGQKLWDQGIEESSSIGNVPFITTAPNNNLMIVWTGGNFVRSRFFIINNGNIGQLVPEISDSTTIPSLSTDVGQDLTYQFPSYLIYDYNGSSIEYSLNTPSWATFDPQTNTLSGTPTDSNIGEVTLEFAAANQQGGTVTFDVPLTVTVAGCHQNPSHVQYDAVVWLREVTPAISTERKASSTEINFRLPGTSDCWNNHVTYSVISIGGDVASAASRDNNDNANVLALFSDNLMIDPTFCFKGVASESIVYDCTLILRSEYDDKMVVAWTYHLIATFQDGVATSVAAEIDQQNVTGENVELPIESILAGGLNGEDKQADSGFTVGDSAFLKISPPDSFVGSVQGSLKTAVLKDKSVDPTKLHQVTTLSKENQLDDGRLVVEVPLIFASENAEIAVTVQWNEKTGRILAEQDDSSSKTVTYRTKVSVASTPAARPERDGAVFTGFIASVLPIFMIFF